MVYDDGILPFQMSSALILVSLKTFSDLNRGTYQTHWLRAFEAQRISSYFIHSHVVHETVTHTAGLCHLGCLNSKLQVCTASLFRGSRLLLRKFELLVLIIHHLISETTTTP